jgi:hypothetical protein
MRTSSSGFQGRIARLLIWAIALMTASLAWAQETTGAITGSVTDPSGAVIAGASVTARDADRGTTWKTETNAEGVYTLPRLPIGNYEVRVEASGFQTAVRPPFNLVLNQTARLDFAMVLGQATQSVEVTSAPPLLQTETTEVGSVMQSSTTTTWLIRPMWMRFKS